MIDKITPEQFQQMVEDPTVDDETLSQYLELNPEESDAFSPKIRLNSDLVEIERADISKPNVDINEISRKYRQRKYRQKIEGGFKGLRFVSEGDSWFQFPFLLKDVIDQLSDDYAIFSLDAGGDTLNNIVNNNEINPAIEAENPDGFLISAGGNDLFGKDSQGKFNIVNIVKRFDGTLQPKDYLNSEFDQDLEKIIGLFKRLFTDLTTRFPALVIFCHGYDYPIPKNLSIFGRPMKNELNIVDPALQEAIVREIIDHANNVLSVLAASFQNVHYVNCRGVVGRERWFDELHPRNNGFEDVAAQFRSVINQKLPSRVN
jgi:hypothetical protein